MRKTSDVYVCFSPLDIANAFNSLPIGHSALEEKSVPKYLQCVLGDYLSNRSLSYVDREDHFVRSTVTCEVSQNAVDPWVDSVEYRVFMLRVSIRCDVICYANDILVVRNVAPNFTRIWIFSKDGSLTTNKVCKTDHKACDRQAQSQYGVIPNIPKGLILG